MITGSLGKQLYLSYQMTGSQCSQINLVDQDNIISNDKSLSKEFSNFFNTAVKNFDIKGPQISHVNEDSDDPTDFTLNKSCRSSQYIENQGVF